MSSTPRPEQPTQAVSPGADPTQDEENGQGRSDMVDPSQAAGAEFAPDPDAERQ
ncbi:hypothetical protein SAMN04515671_3562 [Nakamurella panacisegetis]|uniref:Uncharacterized protein n=1 Tax=Nakamurella panacisegetis TaxID=1090615 RepID=A0A1H0RGC7_9ACTN|nr:hypothetical protein [Nakamurella panacisegetis]SDP28672.1 hypothetical protein SAMN04515671_3562 [Nakamurella panacisegetis]